MRLSDGDQTSDTCAQSLQEDAICVSLIIILDYLCIILYEIQELSFCIRKPHHLQRIYAQVCRYMSWTASLQQKMLHGLRPNPRDIRMGGSGVCDGTPSDPSGLGMEREFVMDRHGVMEYV